MKPQRLGSPANLLGPAGKRAPWMVPVLDAARKGVRLDVITRDFSMLGARGDANEGSILCIGDDNIETVGPSGFPPFARELIRRRVGAADRVTLVACAPWQRFYQDAADAALAGKKVVLIEARRATQLAWAEFIRTHTRPGTVVTYGLVDPRGSEPERPAMPVTAAPGQPPSVR